MTSKRNFGIAGSGVYLPRQRVSADELDALTGLPKGTVTRQFGVVQRHKADPDETTSWMGAVAAEAAFAQAGWARDSVDVIIAACGVMEQPIPSTAVLIQRRLGLGGSGIPAFDINATCLSFLVAFDRVLAGFALGEWRRALIVCADIASAGLDYTDPEAAVLFSDGAAAFALCSDGPHCRLAHSFRTYGEAADACNLEAGGTRVRPEADLEDFLRRAKFRMDGQALFRATSRRFPQFLSELLNRAEIKSTELDCIIPHQASASALEHLKRSLPDGHTKTVDIFSHVGNLIATSLPFTLHVAREEGRLPSGDLGLLIGSSAGISLGGAVIRW